MKYSEETLKNFTAPASDTEDGKIENSIRMIKEAIDNDSNFENLKYEVFVQGSYANNTNVKADSDVDVCVMLKSTFFTEYPEGKTDADYGFTKGTISYDTYKTYVINAIINKFGRENVTIGNKSIKIKSNTYHVEADVVPAFLLKNYRSIGSSNPNNYIEGIRYYSSNGQTVTNYPKIHIQNGISKNNATNYRYKYLIRIFKRIRNDMVDDRIIDKDKITSFLVECLVWNVPNNIITGYSTWTETVKQAIIHLYNAIKDNKHKDWVEVSGRFYLFHSGRKWTAIDAQNFLYQMWNYMGYNNG